MFVIGTAGHVDHGKSTLVQALTGIDPDRWEEEKRRGLTIDLGFAWLTLPSGREVSIVDVPGHERFIKNMLAGVGGIDLALLVIAADEGVMPQTREHLAIIDLLGIGRGVIAQTKADLVDAETVAMAEEEVREAVAGTTLADAPIVACSGATRGGLETLLAAVEAELAETPPRHDTGRPRLQIDRAFTMQGFGTVVTGTLIDGSLSVGEEVEVLPGGLRARIRGLQTHGRQVDVAEPGRRTAVNLSGIGVDDLHRGIVLAQPGTIRPTTAVDVRLKAVPYLSRAVRHNLTVTFHTGSAEVEGKLLLLNARELPPGEEAWAQVRLSAPVVALAGDRYIIRDPNDTLGGGVIVDTDAPRHRRFDEETLERLARLASGAPEDESAEEKALLALAERAREALSAYHSASPLRAGMPQEELRSRLGVEADAYAALLARLTGDGLVTQERGVIALADHKPALTPAQEGAAAAYIAGLAAAPYAPPTDVGIDRELLAFLEGRGDVVRAGDVVFAGAPYHEMASRVEEHLREHGRITLGEVRDMFGTSRKYAQALLEHLDSRRVTRRVGDERVRGSSK